jgi:hypothetical protein
VLKTLRRSLLGRHIQAVLCIVCFGLLGLYQLPSKAQEKKNQQSPQEQSVGRDQAYVRQLLERGTSDAKVESLFKVTSRFTSFNPCTTKIRPQQLWFSPLAG